MKWVAAAEISIDGEEVTRRYISRNPQEFALEVEKLKALKTPEDVEEWLVKRGGRIVSSLGNEVDRIELNIQVRHVTLLAGSIVGGW